jgi:hypothetical protein
MVKFEGFAELQSPKDLLEKLRHDLRRLEHTSHNQYAAFDFFITADCMVDWIFLGECGSLSSFRKNNPIVKITSHVANGAKHFKANQHDSVLDIVKKRYAAKGYVKEGYFADPLLFYLDEEGINLFGVTEIEAYELAQKVFEFWETHLNKAITKF